MNRFVSTSLAALALLHFGCQAAKPADAPQKAPAKTAAAPTVASSNDTAKGAKSSKKQNWAKAKAKADAARKAAGLEHRRGAYDTAQVKNPSAEAKAILDTFNAALKPATEGAAPPPTVVLDEGLSRAAAKLAAEPAIPSGLTAYVRQLAQEAGTPTLPSSFHRIAASDITVEWARKVAAGDTDLGQLVVGVGVDPARPAERAVLVGRRSFNLLDKVSRKKEKEVRLVLDPALRQMTPRLLVVTKDGLERIEGTRSGDLWSFQRNATFDGTIAAVVAYATPKPGENPYRVYRSELGTLQFANAPTLPGDEAPSLGEAVAAARRAWKRPPLRVDDDAYVPPCGEKVQKMAGATVTLDQECVGWISTGSDAQRWSALRLQPLFYDIMDDDKAQFLQIRRDPTRTTVRLAQAFEDLAVEQVRARLKADLARRFPGAKHDVAADATPTALARRWAAKQNPQATLSEFVADAGKDAQKWAKDKALSWEIFAWQNLPGLVDGINPSATPGGYTFGVARGTGPLGEPRYYIAIYFAKPGKP